MSKCICCHKREGDYFHFNGGMICSDCSGSYFTCPDCGKLFDPDDFIHGDAGTGFCVSCEKKRD